MIYDLFVASAGFFRRVVALPVSVVASALLVSVSLSCVAAAPQWETLKAIDQNLSSPVAVAADANEFIYVTQPSLNRVAIFRSNGSPFKEIKGLVKPLSIAVSSRGNLYVGSSERGDVQFFDSQHVPLGRLGSGIGEFGKPVAIAIDGADRVYVLDAAAGVVKVFDPDGALLSTFGGLGEGDGQFKTPTAMVINRVSGEIIITDFARSGGGDAARVQRFGLDGAFRSSFATRAAETASYVRPTGVAVDAAGRIYVTDAFRNVVLVFDSKGEYLSTIVDIDRPLRTPLGVAYMPKSSQLLVASLKGGSVERYSIDVSARRGSLPFAVFASADRCVLSSYLCRDHLE